MSIFKNIKRYSCFGINTFQIQCTHNTVSLEYETWNLQSSSDFFNKPTKLPTFYFENFPISTYVFQKFKFSRKIQIKFKSSDSLVIFFSTVNYRYRMQSKSLSINKICVQRCVRKSSIMLKINLFVFQKKCFGQNENDFPKNHFLQIFKTSWKQKVFKSF